MLKQKPILIASIISICILGALFLSGPVDTVEALVTSTYTPTPTLTPTDTSTPTPPTKTITPTPFVCEDECDCLPCAGVAPIPSPTVSLPLILFIIGSILFIGYWILISLSNSIKDW